MKLKLKNKEIRELIGIEEIKFPKYTSQIVNLANQNAQGTRPKVVGKMSDLIQQFKGKGLDEWEKWYLERHPEAITNATRKILGMITNFKDALTKIDRRPIEQWVRDPVLIKTFVGLRLQKAIIKAVAKKESRSFRFSTPEKESQGIDDILGMNR